MDADLLSRALALSDGRDGLQTLGPGGLGLFRASRTTGADHLIYEPCLCLVLQGAKAIRAGDRLVPFRAGQSLLIGVDLAVATRIVEASPAAPYLAVSVAPDFALLRELAASLPPPRPRPDDGEAFGVAQADARVVAALVRLLEAEGEPRTRAVLAPLARRELHVWMLEGPHGPLLRRLGRADGPAGRIARAVAMIRADLAAPARVAALAREAAMSPSAFHHHFRAVTATTPIQFQKRLRLLEARRRLQAEGATVAAAAFAVGYESPTQFSRDYARAFGHPPREDRGVPARAA